MSGAEWAVTEPALPAPPWTLGKGGRPAQYCRRDLVDGIRYLVKEGIQWRAMPADLPHWRTTYDYASGWEKTGATAVPDRRRTTQRSRAYARIGPLCADMTRNWVKP